MGTAEANKLEVAWLEWQVKAMLRILQREVEETRGAMERKLTLTHEELANRFVCHALFPKAMCAKLTTHNIYRRNKRRRRSWRSTAWPPSVRIPLCFCLYYVVSVPVRASPVRPLSCAHTQPNTTTTTTKTNKPNNNPTTGAQAAAAS